MLINMTPPDLFKADTMQDIEAGYKKLEGNVVLLNETKTVYAVCPKNKGIRQLIKIHCAEKHWEEMIKASDADKY